MTGHGPRARTEQDTGPAPGTRPAPAAGELVVVVDEDDCELGTTDKLAAHRHPARLHRAFSVFVCDGEGRLLLQRRAASKYHFAGLWSNACCSHPRPGEAVLDAARRRLREEIGVTATSLAAAGTFRYRAEDARSGLVEHELDHVVVARAHHEHDPRLDPDEADAYLWVDLATLRRFLDDGAFEVTPWFRPALAVATGGGWPATDPTGPEGRG